LGAVQYQSSLSIIKYGLFAQLSKSFLNDKLNFSAGLRADANNFSATMNNLLKTLSPRVSVAYNFTEKLSMNANLGQYYQLPAYTLLGYRAQTGGALENTEAQYIRSKQAVLGFEYNTLSNTRFTVEGFYKYYDRYPMVRVFS
jgi:outer membrane receptor protein involved in Fe transport